MFWLCYIGIVSPIQSSRVTAIACAALYLKVHISFGTWLASALLPALADTYVVIRHPSLISGTEWPHSLTHSGARTADAVIA